MQPVNPESVEQVVAMRHRTLLIIWFAQLMAIAMFAVLTIVIGGDRKSPPTPDSTLSYIFMGVGALIVLASLAVRGKLAAGAIERRSLPNLQAAYVVSYAMCEAAAVFGLLDFFVTGDRYYYLLFVIGAVGLLLHLPKRDTVLAAMPGNRF